MVKCKDCIFYEEVFAGTGTCTRKKIYILQPEIERNCEEFVPRDVLREDFFDRVLPQISKVKRKKKEGFLARLKKYLSR